MPSENQTLWTRVTQHYQKTLESRQWDRCRRIVTRDSSLDSARPRTFAMLLRGVNVGGRNRVPMPALKQALQEAGCTQVRTYIQSGNAVFRSDARIADAARSAVRSLVTELTGTEIGIVLRSRAELARVVRDNPFSDVADPRKLHVGFCVETPPAERVPAVDPHRSPPDEFAFREREVYLLLPRGAARTKLSGTYLESALGTPITFRNWRTVLRLLGMASGRDGPTAGWSRAAVH